MMKSIILFLMAGAVLPMSACTQSSEPKVSQDEAIAIASQQLPADIVEKAEIGAVFAPEVGPNGAWHIFFENIEITREELGWQAGANVTLGPSGKYKTVLISVDSKNGDILLKNASIGPRLAPAPDAPPEND